jgi:hypothetical protein
MIERVWHHEHRRPIIVAFVGVLLVVAGLIVAIVRSSDAGPDALPTPTQSAPSTPPVTPTTHPSTNPLDHLTTTEGPPVPKKGAYVGAWVYPNPFTQEGRVTSFINYQHAVGQKLKIVHLYRTWGMQIGTSSDQDFARRGKYLLLSWAPVNLNKIVSGQEDAVIRTTAHEIAALPTQVFLEFRWEMDRPNLRGIVHSPQEYIAAWRHVRAIFAAARVSNVAWTWCPTAAGFANGRAQAYYPGDSEVDWVCSDVYPTTPELLGDDESFPSLVQPFMTWAAQHAKPVIIGEFGVPKTYGSRRVSWLKQAGTYIQAHQQIKAIAYFDGNLPDSPPYHVYSLLGDPPALHAFSHVVGDAYFRAALR